MWSFPVLILSEEGSGQLQCDEEIKLNINKSLLDNGKCAQDILKQRINESAPEGRVVHSETKALCPIRNFIIIFILTTLWYDAIM